VIELGLRGVVRLVAREQAHGRVHILIVPEREKRDAHGRVGDRHAVRRLTRGWIARVLEASDLHARDHVRGRDAVHDHLRSAQIHIVMDGQHRDMGHVDPHTQVAARHRADVPKAIHGGTRGRDHDPGRAGREARHTRPAHVTRDAHAIRTLVHHAHAARGLAYRVEPRLLAVLLENDRERREVSARRVDDHVERRRGADELVGARDPDARRRGSARGHVEAGGGQPKNQHHDNQLAHELNDTRAIAHSRKNDRSRPAGARRSSAPRSGRVSTR
jgi:hypothetical protein